MSFTRPPVKSGPSLSLRTELQQVPRQLKPAQVVESLRKLLVFQPLETGVILTLLARQVEHSMLADGTSVRDATDFKLWLEELAEEVRKA